MRILVTGGKGFLGRHVTSKLSNHNDMITLGLSQDRDLNHICCDLLDVQKLQSSLKDIKQIDCIIHLAGRSREVESIQDSRLYFRENVEATNNILEVARILDVKKFVYSSTYLVYGNTESQPVEEQSELSPRSVYAGTKAAGEQLCISFAKSYGIDTTIFRQGMFYGENDEKKRVISLMIQNAKDNKNLEIYGNKVIDFVDVNDAAEAYNLLLATNKSGIFNIASGRGEALVDVATFVKSAINPTIDVIILGSRTTDIPYFVADISKARRELAFSPKGNIYEFISSQAKMSSSGSRNAFTYFPEPSKLNSR